MQGEAGSPRWGLSEMGSLKQILTKKDHLGLFIRLGGFRVKTYTYFSMFVRCIGGNRGNLNQVFYSVSFGEALRLPCFF